MKWVGYTFWGAVGGVDCLALLLFFTMYFNWYGVFWMVWDATYSVWYFAVGGAILGLCFGISTSRNTKIKIPRRVRTGAVSQSQSIPPHLTCQGERG